MQRGGSFESSAESSAVQTATGGGQSSVQRQARHEQRGNVTMSEISQIESEAAHEAGVQSAASRSVQQFDRHEAGARRLDGGGVERSEDTYNKVNERSEAQSRREIPGGEEKSQSSSVNKSETRQTTSVADLGNGATSRSNVTKRSQVSEVSEVSETTSSTRSSRAEPRRLAAGGRSASLQSEHLDAFGTASSRASAGSATPTSTRGGGGGILRELERLLAEEDRYDRARRAVRREEDTSLSARSEQIRREVDNLVATFFDRKRDRTGRSDFFDSATRRAERLVRDFARDDDDPWREEEERWRRQREVRRTGSDDFFDDAVRRAENLVHEMRDRKERRRRDEEDIFSRYGAEIDQFFGGSRRRDAGLGGRRGAGDSFRSASAFADDLVRDFLGEDARGRGADDPWSRPRERADSHSTHVDIDEVLSQASTIGRERATRPARPNTSDVDIEELSASTRSARSRAGGTDRLVDDIVRQFISDDFDEEDTMRERPRGMDRQTSNTSTLDEAASIRSESRMSEMDEEIRHAQRQADEHANELRRAEERRQAEQRKQAEEKADIARQAEEQADRQRQAELRAEERRQTEQRAEEQRQAEEQAQKQRLADAQSEAERQAEAEREDRERRRQERQTDYDAERQKQIDALEQAERQAEQYRLERERRRQEMDVEEQEAEQALERTQEQAEKRRKALEKAMSEQATEKTVSTREEQVASEQSSTRQDVSGTTTKQQSSSLEEQSSFRREEQQATGEERTATEQSSSLGQRTSQQSSSLEQRTSQQSHESAEHHTETAADQQRTAVSADAAPAAGEGAGEGAEETAGAAETAEARSEASAAALQRAEELLFGFVPDWEREEQRWSKVRTERIGESTGDKKVRDLMADFKPLRYVRDDDARAKRLHERKTEEYEHVLSGDVWRGLKDDSRGGRAKAGDRHAAADSVLSELRSARQSTANSAHSARSQFSARKAESMRESSTGERTGSKSAGGRSSKLQEFKSFKNELWQDK